MQIETESILKLLITTCNNKKEPVSSKNDDEIQNLNTGNNLNFENAIENTEDEYYDINQVMSFNSDDRQEQQLHKRSNQCNLFETQGKLTTNLNEAKRREFYLVCEIEKCENLNFISERKQNLLIVKKEIEFQFTKNIFDNIQANNIQKNQYYTFDVYNNNNKKEFDSSKIEISHSCKFSINPRNLILKLVSEKNLINLNESCNSTKIMIDNYNNYNKENDPIIIKNKIINLNDSSSVENVYYGNNNRALINKNNYCKTFNILDDNNENNNNYTNGIISRKNKAISQIKSQVKSTAEITDLTNCSFNILDELINKVKKPLKLFGPIITNNFSSNISSNNIDCNLNEDWDDFVFNSPKNKSISHNNPNNLNLNYKQQTEKENFYVDTYKTNQNIDNLNHNKNNELNINIAPKSIKKKSSKTTKNLFAIEKIYKNNSSKNRSCNSININLGSIKESTSESAIKKHFKPKLNSRILRSRKDKQLPEFSDTREFIKISDANNLENHFKSNNLKIKANSTKNLLYFPINEKLKKEETQLKSCKKNKNNAIETFFAEFITIENIIPKSVQAINSLVLPKIRRSFEDPLDPQKLPGIDDIAEKIVSDFLSLEKENKISNSHFINKDSDSLNIKLKKNNMNSGNQLLNNLLVNDLMVYLQYKTECEENYYTSEDDEEEEKCDSENGKKNKDKDKESICYSYSDYYSENSQRDFEAQQSCFDKRKRKKTRKIIKIDICSDRSYSSSFSSGKNNRNTNSKNDDYNSNKNLKNKNDFIKDGSQISRESSKILKKTIADVQEEDMYEIKLHNKKRKRSATKQKYTEESNKSNSSFLTVYSVSNDYIQEDSKKKLINSHLKSTKNKSFFDKESMILKREKHLKLEKEHNKCRNSSKSLIKLFEDEKGNTAREDLLGIFKNKQNKNYNCYNENNEKTLNKQETLFKFFSYKNKKENKTLKPNEKSEISFNSDSHFVSEEDAEQNSSESETVAKEEENTSNSMSEKSFIINKPKRNNKLNKNQNAKVNADKPKSNSLIKIKNKIKHQITKTAFSNSQILKKDFTPATELAAANKNLYSPNTDKLSMQLTIVCYSDGNIKYIGEASSDKKFHGRGILFYKCGKMQYKGFFQHNKYAGYGVYYFKDGNVSHFGEFKNDFASGTGIQLHPNGSLAYIGQYAHDCFCGIGILFMNNNLTFEGFFKDSTVHGFGTVYYANRHVFFQGFYKKGEKSGTGILNFENSLYYYIGNFEKNVYSKYGVYFYKEKKLWYYGNVKDGKANGFGVEFYENGRMKYIGHYKDDKLEGLGVKFRYEDEKVESVGKYRKGKDFNVDYNLDFGSNKKKCYEFVKKKYGFDFVQMQKELIRNIKMYININRKYV